MAQQSFAGLALLVALFFIVSALSACSTPEQNVVEGPAIIAPPQPEPGTSEFHGAPVGRDTMRGRLTSES